MALPQEFVQNPRRSKRVPAHCRIEVLHGTGSWRSVTQDIGPGGCQIVSPGPIQAGARIAVKLTAADVPETLQVAGRVAWANLPQARAGVSFSAGPRVASWFGLLLQANPDLANAPSAVPDRLAADTRLYLGEPPAEAVDLGLAEILVLGLVIDGVTAGQLRARLGRRWLEARGPFFGLLARKWVVLQRQEAVLQSRWRAILTDAEVLAAVAALGPGRLRPPETPAPPPAGRTPRPVPAQLSLERALASLRAGDVRDAVAHLRTALGFAPQDPLICTALAGLDPHR